MGYALLVALLIVVPFVCGILPTSLMYKEHKSILGIYVYGWFVVFALFQITAIPCVIAQVKFSLLCVVFSVILLIYMCFSLLRIRMLPLLMKDAAKAYKELPVLSKAGWGMVCILLVAQLFILIFYEYIDGDDAYYLGVSLDAIQSDTMYLKNPYTGYPYGGVDMRHAMSPVPLFIAFLAKVSGIHATIIAHSVLGPAFIGLMYGVYTLLGRKLFRDNRKWTCLFVLFVMCFYAFGHVSIFTAETFAYTRTWQGKSMLANLVIPVLYLSVTNLYERAEEKGEWLLLMIVTLSAVFTTSIAVVFVPVTLFIVTIILYLRFKSKKILIKMGLLLVPFLLFGLLYIMN